MRELGEASLASHQMIGRLVFEQKIDHLVGVGSYGKVMVEAAQELGHPSAHWWETKAEAADYVKHHLSRECCVLLKASRGEKFEEIARVLGVEV
jgi:UDP-N-acetylmuramyl pentapeptide synthase